MEFRGRRKVSPYARSKARMPAEYMFMLLKDMAGRRDFFHARSKAHIRSGCLSNMLSDLVPDASHGNLQKCIYCQKNCSSFRFHLTTSSELTVLYKLTLCYKDTTLDAACTLPLLIESSPA